MPPSDDLDSLVSGAQQAKAERELASSISKPKIQVRNKINLLSPWTLGGLIVAVWIFLVIYLYLNFV